VTFIAKTPYLDEYCIAFRKKSSPLLVGMASLRVCGGSLPPVLLGLTGTS